ncbi:MULTISPECIES: flagellar filament capping protein FliD [Brevibacillus]|uniref:Flagellar hook-associated protein 2 n=1 Tax=Brevibacillus borstelensis AK1 TaxID=1300222 RepID=M8DFI8_9BACL|nr:flagellar filament capping protein FliD [Brevibacillus borstelensis]EMT52248.1 flagellar hook-associated protein 2 [Brevibacillus borstelensis AK1]KKX54694.1 flagellar hook protein [Brevibacillus borstelensis cifa_chp40]MED1881779.1 flagellar filament capping protein FliD [Brevibacillus borstelensis]RNB59120.1 flagellar hook protein [Brevibacillus borstelensis]GED55012.1 flagellar hook-associated protein 2 [Brevibacillus borstelensis]
MSPIRFTGMASGLDTEKMIKDLMKAQREPVNRLIRKKQTDEWKRDTYREMNKLLDELRKSVEAVRYSSNFKKKVAFSENDGLVSTKISGIPQFATYSVNVEKLAKAESPAGVSIELDNVVDKGQALGAKGTLTINGVDIAIDVNDSITSINEKLAAQSTDKHALIEASFVNGSLVFTSKSGAELTGVDPSDSSKDNKFFSVNFTADPDGTSGKLKISGSVDSSLRTDGEKGIVYINGVRMETATNTVSFDGIDFTIKGTNGGSPVIVNTKTDEDAIFNQIKGFVDKYNEVIEKINAKISEPKYRSYKPLLDEEKEELPEKTAEKLEAMAKSGILLRDPILKSGLDQMRYAISAPLKVAGVNEKFDTLSEIGIGGPPSGKYAYQENGKLYINETKLREAISNNGEDVLKLFTNYSSSNDPATKFNESGIAERLYTQLTKVIDRVTNEAGSSTFLVDDSVIGRGIKETNKEINMWEDRLKMIEDRYWKQFTAMEKAMSKFQSQGNWFAQMLGQQ